MAHAASVTTRLPRVVIALGLVSGATALHYIGGRVFGMALAVWLVCAVGIGFVLRRWWALALAAIPWPVGVGVGLATGRYAFLGEFWQLAALISMLVGLGGIGLGLLLYRGRRLAHRRLR